MQLRYISILALVAEAGGDPWPINQSLQAGRPAQIWDLARAFRDAGRCAFEAGNTFDEARRRFAASWNPDNGDHPINDSADVRRVTMSLGAQALQLPQIGLELDNVAAALAAAQRTGAVLISTLECRIQQLDNEIGEALKLENCELVEDLEQQAIDDAKSALRQLQSLRNDYSHHLQKNQSTLGTERPAKTQGPAQIPPPTTPPDDVKKWWDSLRQEQKNQLTAQHPPELGNLNGINAATRDTVNQQVMTDDIHRVEDLGAPPADVLANPGRYGLSAIDVTRYGNAVKTRDGLNYDRGPEGSRPALLWAYDPLAFKGRGRAAIAIGNPDYARNTAVIVPGNGSSVAQGWMSGHQDAINLYDQSRAADFEHHPTAVIAWMGYEAPRGFSDLRISEPGLARAGGALLAADVNGLSVTHNSVTPEHVTVVGHSYGATTVADAFAHSNMRANDAVLIGCPGTDLAHRAGDFHLDGGHVYVGAASTDPVTWVGDGRIGLGRDPADEGYGSLRFHAEVTGSADLDRHDHSHYYDIGSEALRSITDIVSGHPERLATDGLLAYPRRQPYIGSFEIPAIPAIVDPEQDRPRDTIRDDHAYGAAELP